MGGRTFHTVLLGFFVKELDLHRAFQKIEVELFWTLRLSGLGTGKYL